MKLLTFISTSLFLMVSMPMMVGQSVPGSPQPERSPTPQPTLQPSPPPFGLDAPSCYFQSADGSIRDLSQLCGQKKSPNAVTPNPNRIPVCYGLDEQYFPCPSDDS